ncbi:MAG: hypothetical protein QQN41_01405 [Nitrosopumilus sp.]
MNKPKLVYIEDQCRRYTFDAKKVKTFVSNHIEVNDVILNLFAGKHMFKHTGAKEIRVDSDITMPSLNYSMPAEKALIKLKKLKRKFDVIIYDPPWNERKSKEFYGGRYIGKFTKLKEDIVSVLKLDGCIISCGYHITEFGKKRGFRLERIAVVNPFGEIRPYFISIERKID